MVKMHEHASRLLQRPRLLDARGWQKRVAVGGRAIPVAFGLLLAACATTTPEPKVVTKVVQVPVVRACVPTTFPQSPSFPDTDSAMRAAPGAGDLLQLLAAGRILRIERLKDLEAVVSACR